MHIVAIGDTHGRKTWKDIIESEISSTREVFIGDYFDSWHETPEDQLNNFYEILAYKRANPERVVLLMGNHDFQYIMEGERYSGYNAENAHLYRDAIKDALSDDSLQMAYEEGGYLFTHAGVTQTWAHTHELNPKVIVQDINGLFKAKPEAFCYDRADSSRVGDNKIQSPIWVRPDALASDLLPGYVHVVGHTTEKNGIDTSKYDKLILIDAIEEGEYLVIQEDGLLVGKV